MTCPICSANSDPSYRPFCSKRCADIDLARWLGEGYAIPSNDPDDANDVIDALEQAIAPKTCKPH